MPNIIFNLEYRTTQFCNKYQTKQEVKKQVDTQKMFKYYDRDTACDKTISTDKAFDYYNYRIGSQGGFQKDKYVDAKECQKQIDKFKPQYVYRSVLSFEKDFAIKTNIIEKHNMEKLVKKSMNSILKQMKLDPQNVVWTAFYHTNTKSPHCHIVFYEKEMTRRKYQIPKNDLNKIRGHVISQLELNIGLYIEKDNRLNELMEVIKQCDLGIKEQKALYETFNNCSADSNELQNIYYKMLELEKKLPINGSLKYNSKNMRNYHNDIREIITDILSLDTVSPFYSKYVSILDDIKSMQEELYGTGIDEYEDEAGELMVGVGNDIKRQEEYYRKKLYELEARIGNMILQNIANGRKDVDGFNEIKVCKNAMLSDFSKDKNLDDEYNEKSKDKKDSFSKKKIFRRRTSILKQGVVRELSKDVQQIYYASLNNKRVIDEVTRNAQKQIYKNRSTEYY